MCRTEMGSVGGILVGVQCFLNDGERAARLFLHGFQSLRLDLFLEEICDLVVELCTEFAERGCLAIVRRSNLLTLRSLEKRLGHVVALRLPSISRGSSGVSRSQALLEAAVAQSSSLLNPSERRCGMDLTLSSKSPRAASPSEKSALTAAGFLDSPSALEGFTMNTGAD